MKSNCPHRRYGAKDTVYLVEERSNPSTDLYVRPAVSSDGVEVICCRFADLPLADELHAAQVVFVRYVPSSWAKLVSKIRPRLKGLAYFMDDDLLDFRATAGLPLGYRFKLTKLATLRKIWLQRQGVKLWVSTPYLQQKYHQWGPQLLLPRPLSLPAGEFVKSTLCRVFYYGTASHGAEIRWLKPVMEEVLRRDDRIVFEISGGEDVEDLYRGLPRVKVVKPMNWTAYQDFLSSGRRHIGLAPVCDSLFNRARSYTKFFDITHCGAVGIYAPGSASDGIINHGANGLVLEMNPTLWAEAILELVQGETERQSMVINAQKTLAELAGKAEQSYLKIRTAGWT